MYNLYQPLHDACATCQLGDVARVPVRALKLQLHHASYVA